MSLSEMSVGIAVPSLNQGRFLGAALDSIQSRRPVRVGVLDGGSTDESRRVIDAHASTLAFWRSGPDQGQAAAINEGIARLGAEWPDVEAVGWLNADDVFLPEGLDRLVDALEQHADWVAVAARGLLVSEAGAIEGEIDTAPFDRARFAVACTICQPATLVRRRAWDAIGGLDAKLDMCFDYDLWWRLARLGPIGYLPVPVAGSRDHGETKTRTRRARYFAEATAIVRRETGRVPWHWYISEALERQVQYEVGRRPPFAGRLRAGAHAAIDFALGRAGRLPV
jgi:GT2 family glycosyltransferase